MSKHEYGAGITVYYPDYEILERSLQALDGCPVVLVCNMATVPEELSGLGKRYECTIIGNHRNTGTAYAWNQIMGYYENTDTPYVLILDQDTVIQPGYFQSMLKNTNLNHAGILCPLVDYTASDEIESGGTQITEVDFCISSGMFLSVECWKKIGGFDERLFIDCVDFDFCMTARERGMKIYRIPEARISHRLGNLKVYRLFGKKIRVTGHDPQRKRLFIRNMILCRKKHGRSVYGYLPVSIISEYLKVILFEDKKLSKITNMNRGVIEGIQGKEEFILFDR